MKRNTFSIGMVLVAILLSSACSSPATQVPVTSATPKASQASGVEDKASLSDALLAGGAEVALGDPVEQAFFTVTGQILKVNGKDVQVFEYESAEKMEADAALVAPDGGSIGTSMVACLFYMWVKIQQ